MPISIVILAEEVKGCVLVLLALLIRLGLLSVCGRWFLPHGWLLRLCPLTTALSFMSPAGGLSVAVVVFPATVENHMKSHAYKDK